MGHGSQYHRGVGSLGTMLPMRVLPGKKMPGRMGGEQVTVQNLEIIDIDLENNVILVKGNVPGPKNSLVFIKSSIKHEGQVNKGLEVIEYTVETPIVEEPVEETKEEATEEVVEEVKEETTEENTKEEEKSLTEE